MRLLSIYPWLFGVLALFLIGLGVQTAVRKRPSMIAARLMFGFTALCFAPSLLMPFFLSGFGGGLSSNYVLWLPILINGLVLVMVWQQMSGYIFWGITDDSFRAALHAALYQLNLPFEETIARLHLPSLNTELQAVVQGWMGVAQIRMKGRQNQPHLRSIANAMRDYFVSHETPTNMLTSVFHIIFGVLFALFAVVFGLQFSS